jgi:type I restriction enzyme R subunit
MVSNFEFLEKDFPVLANFGNLAEKYCYTDSNSCLMKLGMIGETIVNLMFTYDRMQLPQDNTAVARIDTLLREGLLTRDLATILHGLRKVRNKAVHENYSSVADDKIFLPMAYGLCEWFMQTYGDWSYAHKDYVMPEENSAIEVIDKIAEEKKEAELTKKAEETAENAPKVAQEERKKQAYKVANQIPKTEAETRFLIDEQLRMVGWEADTENIRYSKGVRPTKGRKLAIAEYPTNSTVGNRGYADYALFIGEKLVVLSKQKLSIKIYHLLSIIRVKIIRDVSEKKMRNML